jgi:hypothetical protein
MGFGQSFSRVLKLVIEGFETGDESTSTSPILQISLSGNEKNAPTDLAAGTFRYHNCWAGLKTVDMLEQPCSESSPNFAARDICIMLHEPKKGNITTY